jgi:stearoyl-CoA desaturase (Delta-9 desaturase)
VLFKKESLPLGIRNGGWPFVRKLFENTILIGVPFIGSILAIRHAFIFGLTWIDISAFLVFYSLVGIGVGLGFHRQFTHQSFHVSEFARFMLGAFGSMAFQGSVLRWVVDHRRHHAHTDDGGDTHSPHRDPWGTEIHGLRGFLYSHIGWMFDSTTSDPIVYGKDLLSDPLVMALHRTHWIWPTASLLLPYCYGYVLGGHDAAYSAMLFGGFLRTTVLHNIVWAVNSIGHTLGSEDFVQPNRSKNSLALALLTFGDGWHNNHHRFPKSAHHGLAEHEIDVNGWLIDKMERLGLAWNVIRIPRERIAAARAQHPGISRSE